MCQAIGAQERMKLKSVASKGLQSSWEDKNKLVIFCISASSVKYGTQWWNWDLNQVDLPPEPFCFKVRKHKSHRRGLMWLSPGYMLERNGR